MRRVRWPFRIRKESAVWEGIGKSQITLEYAYRHRDDYRAVFWVRAQSLTFLISSLLELAFVLELPEHNEQGQEVIIHAVLRWFRLHFGWLLIYDNLDDLSIAGPFLPQPGGPEHLHTARELNNFASLYQRALTIYEQTLGTRHLDTITALNSLADLYKSLWDISRHLSCL